LRESVDLDWSEETRSDLRAARQRNGHTQAECARALLDLGVDRVSQATVSEWENGQTKLPSPAARKAVHAYIQASPADEATFRALMGDLMGEPARTSEQDRFIEMVLRRFEQGASFSEVDEAILGELARTLGLRWRSRHGG
jgi:transcriptional regulator with XRE-family HTH domain